MNKRQKKNIFIDIAVLIVAAVVIGISMAFSADVDKALGLSYYTEVEKEQDSGADDVEIAPINDGALNVHFVDVGQGDCTIIELPDGKTMIIDGGENNKATEQAIQTFIDRTLPDDFEYFDYAILTHPDSDHCGSFDYVLQNYPSRTVYRPNVEAVGTASNPFVDPGKDDLKENAVVKSTAAYANSVKYMYQTTDDFTSVVYITDPDDPKQTITGENSEYTFEFYSPLSDNYGTKESNAEWNNYSPVMILEYKGFKYAMSGDAEEDNLDEFVSKTAAAKTDGVTDKYDAFDENYCVNVIKAGHHGSRNATTLDYLNVITTDTGAADVYCVISCGEGNSYKHPHQEAIDRYKQIGVKDDNILRTDIVGDITLSVKNDGTGAFKLFYGEKSTVVRETESVLVYRKIGNIELKWKFVGWIVLAVIVVVITVHILFVISNGGKTVNGGAKSKKTNGSRNGGNGRRK